MNPEIKNEKDNEMLEEAIVEKKDESKKVNSLDVANQLENIREKFYQDFKKNRTISIVILVAFASLMLTCIALMMNMPDKMVVIFMAVLVLFIGTYLLNKNLRNNKENQVRTYVENFRKLQHSYIYNIDNFVVESDDAFSKIDEEILKNAEIVSPFTTFQSNELVIGKYKDFAFKSFNAATYKEKQEMTFFGKVYYLKLNKDYQGRMVVYASSIDNAKGPASLEKLTKLDDINNFKVYSSFDENLNSKMIDALKPILNKIVLNENKKELTITIVNDELYVFYSYINLFIDINVKDSFKESTLIDLKNDLKNVLEIADRI